MERRDYIVIISVFTIALCLYFKPGNRFSFVLYCLMWKQFVCEWDMTCPSVFKHTSESEDSKNVKENKNFTSA